MVDLKFYIFGGCYWSNDNTAMELDDLWRFDCETSQWDCLTSPAFLTSYSSEDDRPSLRRYPSLSSSNGDLILFGGLGRHSSEKYDLHFLNDTWRYDISHNEWILLQSKTSNREEADVPIGRYGHLTSIYDNKLFLFSGFAFNEGGEKTELNDLWYFDLNKKYWENVHRRDSAAYYRKNSSKPGIRYGSAAARRDDILYVFGGYGNRRNHNDLWSFDLSSYRWSLIHGDRDDPNCPSERYCHGLEAIGHKLFLFGGRPVTNQEICRDIWCFDLDENSWDKILEYSPGDEINYVGKAAYASTNDQLLAFGGEQMGERIGDWSHTNRVFRFNVDLTEKEKPKVKIDIY